MRVSAARKVRSWHRARGIGGLTVFRGATVAAVMVVLFALLVLGCGSTAPTAETTRTTTDSPTMTGSAARAAIDFSGTTIDGVEVSLSEYRGKPLVLAFMASW